jgi:multidrug efflux pump subunit AcrA (membrane-fusion protein)
MKVFWSLIVVAALGAGGWWWWHQSHAAKKADASFTDEGLFKVKKGELPITLTENGTLVAKESQKIVPEFRGRGKIISLIEEGKVVAEGDELCKFDTTELQQQVDQVQLDIAKAEADLAASKTELEIQEKQNAQDLKKAQIAVEKAEKDKQRYIEGDAPQDRRKLEITIKETTTTYEKAKKKYEDDKTLFEKDFINKSERDQDEQDKERAEVSLESAKVAMDIYEKFILPMTTRDKDVAVEDAGLGLETATKRAESKLRQMQVAQEQNQKRLDKMKQQLKERQDELAKMVLKAPCPGIVIYGDPRYGWWDQNNFKVGGEIWGGNTLFTIPDLRVMQVKVQIHEADINKIKTDMNANVTMDTYDGLNLKGKVTKIAAIAAGSGNPYGGDQQEVKKFDVEITLEGTTAVELKPGISAKAEVMIDTRKDTLYVPLQCVFLEAGKQWCYAVVANVPNKREVKPGLSNDTYLEILEGLKEGEEVLLYNPTVPTGAAPPEESDEAKQKAKTPAPAPAGPPPGPASGP